MWHKRNINCVVSRLVFTIIILFNSGSLFQICLFFCSFKTILHVICMTVWRGMHVRFPFTTLSQIISNLWFKQIFSNCRVLVGLIPATFRLQCPIRRLSDRTLIVNISAIQQFNYPAFQLLSFSAIKPFRYQAFRYQALSTSLNKTTYLNQHASLIV